MEGFDIDIPENADKILFVEDLMNYVSSNSRTSFTVFGTVEEYREFIYNAFDDTMRNAVDFLINQLQNFNDVEFGITFLEYPLNTTFYKWLVTYLQEKYLSEGFMPRKFLYYCVHAVNLAVLFAFAGNPEVLRFSVQCILDVIQGYNMASDGWDVLCRTASTYEKVHKEYGESLCFSRGNDYTYELGLSESAIMEIFMTQLLDLDDFVISITEWEEVLMAAQNDIVEAQLQELNSVPKLERRLFQDISTSEASTSVSEESDSMELLDDVLEELSGDKK